MVAPNATAVIVVRNMSSTVFVVVGTIAFAAFVVELH